MASGQPEAYNSAPTHALLDQMVHQRLLEVACKPRQSGSGLKAPGRKVHFISLRRARRLVSLAGDAVFVAVETGAVTRITEVQRRGSGRSRRGTTLVVWSAMGFPDGRVVSGVAGVKAAFAAVVIAGVDGLSTRKPKQSPLSRFLIRPYSLWSIVIAHRALIVTQSPMNAQTSPGLGGSQFDGSLSPLARFEVGVVFFADTVVTAVDSGATTRVVCAAGVGVDVNTVEPGSVETRCWRRPPICRRRRTARNDHSETETPARLDRHRRPARPSASCHAPNVADAANG